MIMKRFLIICLALLLVFAALSVLAQFRKGFIVDDNNGGNSGSDGPQKGDVHAVVTHYGDSLPIGQANLVEGEQYFIEDTLFTAVEDDKNGWIIPPSGTIFTGADGNVYKIDGTCGPGCYLKDTDGEYLESDDLVVTFYTVRSEGGNGGSTAEPVKGELLYSVTYTPESGIDFSNTYLLEEGKKYYVEDTLFTAVLSNNGFPAPPIGTSFVDESDNEIYYFVRCSGGELYVDRSYEGEGWDSAVGPIRIYKVSSETYNN